MLECYGYVLYVNTMPEIEIDLFEFDMKSVNFQNGKSRLPNDQFYHSRSEQMGRFHFKDQSQVKINSGFYVQILNGNEVQILTRLQI